MRYIHYVSNAVIRHPECRLSSIPCGPHRHGLTPGTRNSHRLGHTSWGQLDRGLRGALCSRFHPLALRLSLHIERRRRRNPLAARASFLDRLARGHRRLMAGLDLVCAPTLLRVRVCTCDPLQFYICPQLTLRSWAIFHIVGANPAAKSRPTLFIQGCDMT